MVAEESLYCYNFNPIDLVKKGNCSRCLRNSFWNHNTKEKGVEGGTIMCHELGAWTSKTYTGTLKARGTYMGNGYQVQSKPIPG
jgi:hypothetical protein